MGIIIGTLILRPSKGGGLLITGLHYPLHLYCVRCIRLRNGVIRNKPNWREHGSMSGRCTRCSVWAGYAGVSLFILPQVLPRHILRTSRPYGMYTVLDGPPPPPRNPFVLPAHPLSSEDPPQLEETCSRGVEPDIGWVVLIRS